MSYPILYSSTETDFSNNGLGILGDCISCEVTEEANGIFELAMQYPMSGIHYEDIVDRSIIKAKADQFRDPQLFRVYSISKPMSGIVTVLAEHISYDLSGIPVAPFTAGSVSLALADLKNNAVTDCPFDFWTDKDTSGTFSVSVPSSIRSRLGGVEGSILDVYGGEYEFDNYKVKLHNSRGMNRGVSIRYGKTLTDIKQEQNCASVATGIYPYWAGDVDGNTVLVELPEKIVEAPGTYNFVKIRTVDFTESFESQPTVEQLRSMAESYVKSNNIGIPNVSLTVSFAQLEQTDEYKHLKLLEQVLLFDTVNVEFPALGVSATAKAIKIVYDSLADRVKSITLGSTKANIADTIATQQQEIAKKPSISLVQSIAMTLTSAILGAKGGAVRILDTDGDGMPDTLYVADNPDPSLAVKVWRWNYEGWAGSKTGYVGPFILGATLDDGLLADAVTAAHLVAGTIMSKDDGKTFFLDLDSGILRMNATDLKISGHTTEQIADSRIDDKLTDYSTTAETNSLIFQSANQITSSVSKTYATKTSVDSVKTTANNAASKADSAAAKADSALSDAKNYTNDQLETVKGELSTKIEQTPNRLKLSVLRTGYFPLFEYIPWTNWTAGTFGNVITLNSSGITAARLITTEADSLTYARGSTLKGALSYQVHKAIVGTSSSAHLRLSFVVIYADGTNTSQHILYEDGKKTMAAVCPKTSAALNLTVEDKKIKQIYVEVLTDRCSGKIEVGEVWANVEELSGKSTTLSLTADGARISSANIVLKGAVSFEDLSGSGTTTINGSNITTGTIANADRSALFDLDGKRFRMGTSSGERVFIDKSGIQWYGGTATTGATAQGIIKNGLTTGATGDTTVYGADTRYQKYGWYHGGRFQGITVEQVDDEVMVSGKLSVNQEVSCRTLKAWDAKERIVPTVFGNIGMEALETPQPTFADWGEGVCNEDGLCLAVPDARFAETVSASQRPAWIVTDRSGEGSLWAQDYADGALIHGKPGQHFAWLCLNAQRGFEGQYAVLSDAKEPSSEDGDWLLCYTGDLAQQEEENLDELLLKEEET